MQKKHFAQFAFFLLTLTSCTDEVPCVARSTLVCSTEDQGGHGSLVSARRTAAPVGGAWWLCGNLSNDDGRLVLDPPTEGFVLLTEGASQDAASSRRGDCTVINVPTEAVDGSQYTLSHPAASVSIALSVELRAPADANLSVSTSAQPAACFTNCVDGDAHLLPQRPVLALTSDRTVVITEMLVDGEVQAAGQELQLQGSVGVGDWTESTVVRSVTVRWIDTLASGEEHTVDVVAGIDPISFEPPQTAALCSSLCFDD